MRIGPAVALTAVSGSVFVESSPRSSGEMVTTKGTSEAVMMSPVLGFLVSVLTPRIAPWSGLVVAML